MRLSLLLVCWQNVVAEAEGWYKSDIQLRASRQIAGGLHSFKLVI